MNIRVVYGRDSEKHKNYNLFWYTFIPANGKIEEKAIKTLEKEPETQKIEPIVEKQKPNSRKFRFWR